MQYYYYRTIRILGVDALNNECTIAVAGVDDIATKTRRTHTQATEAKAVVEEAHQLEAAAQVRQEAREALRTATRRAEEAKAAALEALAFDSGVEGRAHGMHPSLAVCACACI